MIFPFSFLLFHPLISFCTRFLPDFPFRLHPTPPVSPPALPPPSPTSRRSSGSIHLRPCPPGTQLCPLPHPTSGHPLASPRPRGRLPRAPTPACGAVPTPAWGCPHTCAGLVPAFPPCTAPTRHPRRLTPRSCTPPSRLCPASSGRCFALRSGGSRKDV